MREAMVQKSELEDLAVFGGQPAFEQPLHVGSPNVGDREVFLERVNEVLDRNRLTNKGPCVRELEQRIADLIGARHCILMCNGTVALEIVIRACGLTGEVILPSFTFIATAHALQWQEITPVFCDIDARTHNIDPARIERHITPRTTGIIGVHLWGRPCDTDALAEIADRRRLTLLFDAAHGFGCSHQGRMIGKFGAAEVFSFHATKFFHTFEGGAVTTDDDQLAEKIRLMKNFGFAGKDKVIYIGTNGKMNELCAAMGLTGLDCLDQFIETNKGNYHAYRECLSGRNGLELASYNEAEKCNYQYIILEVDESQCGLSRDELQQVLLAENVLARRYFTPGCHRMEPYRLYFPHAGLLLPETERLSDCILTLPTGSSTSVDQIRGICEIVRVALANSERVKAQLGSEPSRA